MRKITLAVPARAKDALVTGVQGLGCLHVVAAADDPASAPAGGGPDPKDARTAERYLADAPYQRPAPRAPRRDGDPAALVRRVLANKQRRRELLERREELRARLDALAPWGEFDLPEAGALAGRSLWFYAVPRRKLARLAALDAPWREVARSHQTAYVVVIAREQPPADVMPVAPTPADGWGTRALRRALAETDDALERVELARVRLTRARPAIRRALARMADADAFRHARETMREHEGVAVLQGWAPVTAVPRLRRFVTGRGAAMLAQPPAADDRPPTLMHNARWTEPGEDLARFYAVPPARDWDPSGVLLVSFALFFAAILSDAGYGAVVAVLAALPFGVWQSAAGARVRRMTAALGAAAIGFGALAGSYFGLTPPPGSVLGRLHVIDLQDYGGAMQLAVLMGVGHIVLANAAAATAHWPRRAARARVGWVLVAAGAYAAWLGREMPGVAVAGGAVAAAGLLAVAVFRSERPVRRPVDHLKRAGDGLLGAAQITQLFGDVLSYLRLFALGLATAMLASAFNTMAGQAADSVAGVGVLLAMLVAVIGHALTFALAVVSGVVHGLRLNYIEFYGWALNGEGHAFIPLRRTEVAA